MIDSISDWKSFVAAGREYSDENQGVPVLELVRQLDRLYSTAYRSARFPPTEKEHESFIHMSFMICHRALLAAATYAASGSPEDCYPVTRRALEAARAARAVTLDPANLKLWMAKEDRLGRWHARMKDVKPQRLSLNYEGVREDPDFQKLGCYIGVLSDFSVHFTPEHLLDYEFSEEVGPGGQINPSFGSSERAVMIAIVTLTDCHHLILRAFDSCLENRLLAESPVQRLFQESLDLRDRLVRDEELTEEDASS